jgi:hypothetical protein
MQAFARALLLTAGAAFVALFVAPAFAPASPASGAAPGSPLAVVAAAQEEKQASETTEQLIARLRSEKEKAERSLFSELARSRSRDAAVALIEVYDEMASPAGKLRVVQALPSLVDVDGATVPVLDKLTHVATNDKRRLLRLAAVEALAQCREGGRGRLAAIVDAPADDEIRIEAMRLHVASATAADVAWYRRLWKPEEALKDQKKSKKKDEEIKEPRRLVDVRRLAFEGLVPHLALEELIEALTTEGGPNLRRVLAELRSRQSKEAQEMSARIFGTLEADPLVRLEAGKLLFELLGAEFIEEAERAGTNRLNAPVLREALAELVSRHADEKTLGTFAKHVGKGKAEEKIFYALACAKFTDEKFAKALRKLLDDKELEVRLAAIGLVARRGDREALEALDEILLDSEEERELVACLEALSLLRDGEVAWGEKVRAFVDSDTSALRHAALLELTRRLDTGALEVFGRALDHSDWSTRLAAIDALRTLRHVGGVPLLIARLPKEEGRVANAIAEALFELTGQLFQMRANAWEAWWRDNSAKFEVISTNEFKQLARELEAQRLELTTGVNEFFGIEITSHRIAFVLDVSGSMEERVKGQYTNELGEMRIAVAKKELTNFLDRLDPGAWFNIVPFSDRVVPWRASMARHEGEALAEAKEFVADLIATGGTNIYGGLEAAFADPETDTIVLLSDGEPSVGDVIEINEIRRHVKRWNEHRGIVIHTVQIGATFELLQWLALDSGGQSALIP